MRNYVFLFILAFFILIGNVALAQCTQTITNSSASIVVSSGQQLCIRGDFSGTVIVNSGGSASLLGNITASGSVTISLGAILSVCGNINVTGSLNNQGLIKKSLSTSISGTGSIILGSVESSNSNSIICSELLPVELISFDTKDNANNTIINWQTASEVNSNYFEIWRSVDGIKYELLGKSDAKGYSAQIVNYSFTDEEPAFGITYYKLLQYDMDGSTQEFGPIVSMKLKSVASLEVYPNPVLDGDCYLQIQSEKTDKFKVQIFDNLGLQVLEEDIKVEAGANLVALDLKRLVNSGIYYVNLSNANQFINSTIFISRE